VRLRSRPHVTLAGPIRPTGPSPPRCPAPPERRSPATKSLILTSKIDKRSLSESDICDLFISPAIKNAGWDQLAQIRREVTLAPGPVTVRGNVASRNKKKKKFADYVLYKEPGVPIAIVEAKDNNHTVCQGLQQALGYAEILNVPSAYSSNGDAFASHNKVPEAGEDIETQFLLESVPPPPRVRRDRPPPCAGS
jgi:type I restriction enzyme R subunit